MDNYFTERCRICESTKKFIDIFDKKNEIELRNFQILISEEVTETDGLSRWFCKICAEKIKDFSDFRQKCIETSQKYKSLINDLKLLTQEIKTENCSDDPLKDNTQETSFNVIREDLIPPVDGEELKNQNDSNHVSVSGSDEEDAPTDCSHAFKCQFCDKKYTKRSNLSRHIRSFHKNFKFSCIKCKRTFTQSTSLKDHIKKIHPEITASKILPKLDCDSLAETEMEAPKLTVITKLIRSDSDKNFQCKLCQKSYNHANNLSRHVYTVHKNQKFVCEICNKMFTQRGSLREHQSNIHPDYSTTLYHCNICPKSFNTIKMFQQHERRHDPNLPKEKPVKPLRDIFRLDEVRKPIKKYRRLCPYCGKFYKNVEEHIHLHTGDKLNECSYCKRRFTFKTTLAQHIRIHTGEKPYKCEVCSKSFRASHHLKEHRNIHSDKKQFQCQLCLKSFSSKLTLYKHNKTCHPDKI